MVVPKKVVAKATKRNRLKRVLGAKLNLLLNKKQPSLDGVFILKKTSSFLDENHMKEELETILRRLC